MSENTYLTKAKEIYDDYGNGRMAVSTDGAIFSNDKRNIHTLRSHARGVQDTTKYMNILDPFVEVKSSDGRIRRTRKMSISWEPVRILPKFRSLAIDKITNIILIPKTEAVDELARYEKKITENRMKLVRDPNSQAVIKTQDEFSEIETKEDVDFMFKMGGIRLPIEMMMKDSIDITTYRSNYHSIAKMVAEDIIDINAMAVHQHNVNGHEIIEYVDISRVIVRPSIHPDFRDSDFRGFISNKTANQIILEGKFTDPDVIERIQAMDKNHTLKSTDNLTIAGRRENFSNSENFHTHGIEVMTLYFLEKVTKRFIDSKRKGVQQWEEVDEEFKLSKRAISQGKKINEFSEFVLKTCKWIVKEDIVYNEGIVDQIVYEGNEGNKSIVWPITIYAGHEPSLISRCIEFDDDLQIANYTMRNLYATIPPAPRMLIFANLIKDRINIGGDEYSIMDLITNYQATGIMVLEGQEYDHEPGEANVTPPDPIRFIPSGVAEDLQQLSARMLQSVDFIRQVTGINEVADGTSQNKDMLKSVMEGLSSATNSALSSYVSMYIDAYRSMIKYTALKYKMMALNGELELGNLPISETVMKHVKLAKDAANHEWGIMVDVVSKEAKDMLIYDLQQRKDMLPADAYFTVWNIIESGDLKKAQFMLSKYIERATKNEHERQMQIAQATAKANAEAAMATEQTKAKTIQVENQGKLMVVREQALHDMERAKQEHVRKLEYLEREGEIKKDIAKESIKENNRNALSQ